MSWGRGVSNKNQRVAITQSHFQKHSGFGLIESFISIILLTGFLLSACHLLLNLFSSKLLDETASKFINSFQKARQLAIETNSSIQIKAIGSHWGEGWELSAFNSSSENQTVYKQSRLEEPVTFISHQQQSIIFKPNGMTTNLNPLGKDGIVFCNANGKGRQLTMLASGKVQITNIKQECGVSS